MPKNTVTRWILRLNDEQDIILKTRECSRYMPINRMVEEVVCMNFDLLI